MADPTLYGQTCQAFASALNEILVKFEERIAGLEAEFTKFAKRPEGKVAFHLKLILIFVIK